MGQPRGDRRPRPRDHHHRLARRDLRARRRRRRRRWAAGACGGPRRGPARRCPEPVPPAHGRPLRVRILDVSVAPASRFEHDLAADRPAFRAPGRVRGGPDRAALDDAFGSTWEGFDAKARGLAERLAGDPDLPRRLARKARWRAHDERIRPLQAYRDDELARSYECFFGPDPSYHQARRRFVHKLAGHLPLRTEDREFNPDRARAPARVVGRIHARRVMTGR